MLSPHIFRRPRDSQKRRRQKRASGASIEGSLRSSQVIFSRHARNPRHRVANCQRRSFQELKDRRAVVSKHTGPFSRKLAELQRVAMFLAQRCPSRLLEQVERRVASGSLPIFQLAIACESGRARHVFVKNVVARPVVRPRIRHAKRLLKLNRHPGKIGPLRLRPRVSQR